MRLEALWQQCAVLFPWIVLWVGCNIIRLCFVYKLPPGARVSKDCRDLLLRLLERNPDARITFAEFFTHPFVDLEHMPSAESIVKAKELVLQAVQKDQEGERSAALFLYCSALEHFVPAIHYETDRQRKDALRQKVSQYVSRAEELKALVASDNRLSFEEARTSRDVLRGMSHDQPRLLAALEMSSTAIAKEESGSDDHEALDVYQQCLGELLLVLAAEPQGRRRELLHGENLNEGDSGDIPVALLCYEDSSAASPASPQLNPS